MLVSMRWLFAMLVMTSCASPSYPEPKPDVSRVSDLGMPIAPQRALENENVLV